MAEVLSAVPSAEETDRLIQKRVREHERAAKSKLESRFRSR